jgi:RNA recognition motif-containing protein
VYVGGVPLDFDDVHLTRLLDTCGKTSRVFRPKDPLTQLPSAFCFVTYQQGLCALRCKKLLHNYLIDPEEGMFLDVRSSQRETALLQSIENVSSECLLTAIRLLCYEL